MFNNLKKFVLVSGVMGAGVLQMISPQAAKADTLKEKAYVPFEFRVGKKLLPSGEYRLVETTAGGNCYQLKHVPSGKAIYVLFPKVMPVSPSKLIFNKEDRGYALRVVG